MTGSIDTTITNTGVIDGAVTFGTGNDILAHSGEITGSVDLGDGDDEVRFGRDAILGARADGGLGDDVFELGDTGNSEREFDLATLSGFETVRITGADPANTGWELLNGLAFLGLLDIEAGGALDADATTPVALDRTGDVRNAGRIGADLAFAEASTSERRSTAAPGRTTPPCSPSTTRRRAPSTSGGSRASSASSSRAAPR